MARIRFNRAYFGIQPGTVTEENSAAVLAKLTKVEQFWDEETKQMRPITPIASIVPDSTPTTAQLERNQAAAQAGDAEAQAKSVEAVPADKSMVGRRVANKG